MMDSTSNSPGATTVSSIHPRRQQHARHSFSNNNVSRSLRFDESTANDGASSSFALVVKPSYGGGSAKRGSMDGRYSTTLALTHSSAFHHNQMQRIPLPARSWRATILSANVREARVEYDVRSEFLSEAISATSVVRRRYREFTSLHHALSKDIRGYHIWLPDLPPKNFISVRSVRARAEPEFVAARRLGLQLWLRYVCEHSVLRNSTALREFLFDPATSAVTLASSTAASRLSANMSVASASTVSPSSSYARSVMYAEMSSKREADLWKQSLQVQSLVTHFRFGNTLTSLASLKTRVENLQEGYRGLSNAATALMRADGKVVRGRARFSSAMLEWSRFEQNEGGQAFGFLAKFAREFVAPTNGSVRAFYASAMTTMKTGGGDQSFVSGAEAEEEEEETDASRLDMSFDQENGDPSSFNPDDHEEFISSFIHQHQPSSHPPPGYQQADATSQEIVLRSNRHPLPLPPVPEPHANVGGATIESPDAAGASMDIRSLEQFCASLTLWGHVVLSKASKEGGAIDPRDLSRRDAAGHRAQRVADEWTEVETVRPKFLKDVSIKFVQDQILRSRSEQERWKALENALLTQEVHVAQLASLDAIGDEPERAAAPYVAAEDLLDRGVHEEENSGISASSAAIWAKEAVNDAITGSSQKIQNPTQHHPFDLDADLDRAQEMFRKLTSPETLDTTALLNTPSERDGPTRHKNPFLHLGTDDEYSHEGGEESYNSGGNEG